MLAVIFCPQLNNEMYGGTLCQFSFAISLSSNNSLGDDPLDNNCLDNNSLDNNSLGNNSLDIDCNSCMTSLEYCTSVNCTISSFLVDSSPYPSSVTNIVESFS
jgi:hypothetical protein